MIGVDDTLRLKFNPGSFVVVNEIKLGGIETWHFIAMTPRLMPS